MKAFRNYLVVSTLLLGFLSFYIPVRYHTPYPRDIGPQFDSHIRTTYIEALDQTQPALLLLGDSMLAPAVDEGTVEKQLGQKTMLVSLPGTASTIWYLMIKNNIVVAGHKPKYLVVFFRDSMMTVPGYRVSGRYFEQIDEFATPNDKLLIERAYINQMSPLDKIMERYMPLYGSRWTIRQSIDYYMRHSLAKALLHCDPGCADKAMESVFKANNLDVTFLSDAIAASDDYIYTNGRLDFNQQIDKSFLPEIVRLCKENNIQLVLVRMPIRRFEKPGTEPKGLSAYIQDLASYSSENGVAFFDFDNKKLTGEYFADDVHLNKQGQVLFTQWLTEALMPIVR